MRPQRSSRCGQGRGEGRSAAAPSNERARKQHLWDRPAWVIAEVRARSDAPHPNPSPQGRGMRILMPQLLLELFSEEIPARMQKRAEEDLARLFGRSQRKAAGLDAKAIKTFSGPRRIGLFIDDLPAKAADVNEEKKGPRVGSPDQAIQGFLKQRG